MPKVPRRPRPLSTEVAGAVVGLLHDLPARQGKARRASDLVTSAKRLERLQARRRKLRAELRRVEAEIRHERRMLRALAGAVDEVQSWQR
jgi:hypothetical protein